MSHSFIYFVNNNKEVEGEIMDRIKRKIDHNFKFIEENLGNSADIVKRKMEVNGTEIGYIYLESVASDDKISNFFMKDISSYIKNKKKPFFDEIFDSLENTIPNSHLKVL